MGEHGVVAALAEETFAVVLNLGELRGVLFELAAEAVLLETEIAEITFVDAEDLRFDHSGASSGVRFGGEFAGEFVAADGIETRFESGDAEETPFGVGNGLDEVLFFVGFGLELAVDLGDEFFVSSYVVGWQDDGAAGEPGFQSIVGRLQFSFRRGRAGRELRIRAVCFDLSWGCHRGISEFIGALGRTGGFKIYGQVVAGNGEELF